MKTKYSWQRTPIVNRGALDAASEDLVPLVTILAPGLPAQASEGR